jgi:hypothetical protein
MRSTRIDKIKNEAIALGTLLRVKHENCGTEEWERMQYLRTEILKRNIKKAAAH